MMIKFLVLILICISSPLLRGQDSINEFNINDWVVQLKDSVVDIDGNVYHTQQIGTQVWMLENLKTTRFNNGKQIVLAQKNSIWLKTILPAYSRINEEYYDEKTKKKNYRVRDDLVYNFYVVKDSSKICPCGWHVPKPNEWKVLENYMGQMNEAFAPKLYYYLEGETPPVIPSIKFYQPFDIGFNSMLYGFRTSYDGSFVSYGGTGIWWSTELSQVASAWYGIIDRGYGLEDIHIEEQGNNEKDGYTIKCIKDQ